MTDVGQLEDKSFNEGGWCGTIAGATSVGGTADVIVTEDPADYQANMQTFIDQGYQIIVTYGFALGNDDRHRGEGQSRTSSSSASTSPSASTRTATRIRRSPAPVTRRPSCRTTRA